MRAIIAGSRTATKRDVWNAIRCCPWADEITEVISGGARGADMHGESWAVWRGLPVRRILPDWDMHGRAAGPMRNAEMAEIADALIAVWDGQSRGTSSMLREAKNRGLRLSLFCIGQP